MHTQYQYDQQWVTSFDEVAKTSIHLCAVVRGSCIRDVIRTIQTRFEGILIDTRNRNWTMSLGNLTSDPYRILILQNPTQSELERFEHITNQLDVRYNFVPIDVRNFRKIEVNPLRMTDGGSDIHLRLVPTPQKLDGVCDDEKAFEPLPDPESDKIQGITPMRLIKGLEVERSALNESQLEAVARCLNQIRTYEPGYQVPYVPQSGQDLMQLKKDMTEKLQTLRTGPVGFHNGNAHGPQPVLYNRN
ncbi:MAG TPA: hypothetical protein PLL06_21340 [Acidobacteriota bacterium]|nr:hypothetical protein [Acidobacteriota bacterium]